MLVQGIGSAGGALKYEDLNNLPMSANGFPSDARAIYLDTGSKVPYAAIVTSGASMTSRFTRLDANNGWIMQIINYNNQPITTGNVSVRVYYQEN